MSTRSALGRGLGSLIPQKSFTEQVFPEAHAQVLAIPVHEIAQNPRQPRQFFSKSDLEDLIESIKEHGIIQPLVVTRDGSKFELIAGERRLRAATMLGLKTVPAIVRDATDQQKLELALIENIQRQDLNAVEESLAYRALIEEFNLTQEEVGRRVGKSRSNVTNILRLLDLPEHMLTAVKEGRLTKTHARTLLAELNPQKQEKLFAQMLEGGMSVREAEARVSGVQRHVSRAASTIKDPNILAHEKRLRELLGTKVAIKESAGRGTISIAFYSREELLGILDQLSGF